MIEFIFSFILFVLIVRGAIGVQYDFDFWTDKKNEFNRATITKWLREISIRDEEV